MKSRKKRKAPARAPLNRAAVLEAALAILKAEGAPALTMRRLGEELGVEAMSLYNHVRDKHDLLAGISGLVISRIQPPDPKLPWRKRIETIFVRLYDALIANPWLVMMLASEQAEPRDASVIVRVDTILAIFAEAGLTPAQQVSAFRGMLALCFGLVLTHTVGLLMSPSEAEAHWSEADADQWREAGATHFAKLAPQFFITRPADDLQFMLGAFVAALQKARA
jgi:AcrR family transcriptional regulator